MKSMTEEGGRRLRIGFWVQDAVYKRLAGDRLKEASHYVLYGIWFHVMGSIYWLKSVVFKLLFVG